MSEESIAYFFEEPVRRVQDVDAPRRFDETISYSELNDSADRFATLPAPRSVKRGGRDAVHLQDNPQVLIAWDLRGDREGEGRVERSSRWRRW